MVNKNLKKENADTWNEGYHNSKETIVDIVDFSYTDWTKPLTFCFYLQFVFFYLTCPNNMIYLFNYRYLLLLHLRWDPALFQVQICHHQVHSVPFRNCPSHLGALRVHPIILLRSREEPCQELKTTREAFLVTWQAQWRHSFHSQHTPAVQQHQCLKLCQENPCWVHQSKHRIPC